MKVVIKLIQKVFIYALSFILGLVLLGYFGYLKFKSKDKEITKEEFDYIVFVEEAYKTFISLKYSPEYFYYIQERL